MHAMCTEPESRPPVAPLAGAAVSHEDLELVAADGNHLAAFAAWPDGPLGAGVVLLPDIRGLSPFYEELALRLAERGHAALAVDYYGRVAGVGKRGPDFPAMEMRQHLDIDDALLDAGAGIDRLREAGAGRVFTLGCCYGGSVAWLASTGERELAGAIGFHGGLGDRGGKPGPIARAAQMKAPILAVQGGADPHITLEDDAAFDAALSAAGVEHEVVIEPDAPHSFFDVRYDEFAEQSADAWRRALAFIDQHS
jgi:carboxymethylenebutenolidase